MCCLCYGLTAIVHNPEQTYYQHPHPSSNKYADVQSHVNAGTAINYFHVNWKTPSCAGESAYPSAVENSCQSNGGEVLDDDYCLCDTTLTETVAYTVRPTRDQVLELKVGAFDISMYDTDDYTMVAGTESTTLENVTVFKPSSQANDYSTDTIFRIVKDEYNLNKFIYLKNIKTEVFVCDGNFSFPNPPTFYDIASPELHQAYREIDAYIDHVHDHPNTPPFACKSLMKQFGFSNPNPDHVLSCSQAFKSGLHTYVNPSDNSDTLEFGTLGERGNLGAVVASIFLADDVLSPTADLDPASGGVKSPLLRLFQPLRSLELERAFYQRRTNGLINANVMGEGPYRIPDQFSFWSPHYTPPGHHQESAITAPESEVMTLDVVATSMNALFALSKFSLSDCDGGAGSRLIRGIFRGSCGSDSDKYASGYLSFIPTGDRSDSRNVVEQLSLMFLAGRISPVSQALIEKAYDDYSVESEDTALQVAVALLLSTSEYGTTTNIVAPSDTERLPNPADIPASDIPYKAIVHINLFGGFDSLSMLTPHEDGCPDLYGEYSTTRGPNLAFTTLELEKIAVGGDSDPQPCDFMGVNKEGLYRLAEIYKASDGIFFTNIGYLTKPTTAANFKADTKGRLFSHHDMTKELFYVDANRVSGVTGVLGRLADVLTESQPPQSIGQLSINRNLEIMNGKPDSGRKVDVLSSRNGLGVDEFIR